MTLAGVMVERARGGQNPHWVAVWNGETDRGKVVVHDRLPLWAWDTCREAAEQYAMDNEPEWKGNRT